MDKHGISVSHRPGVPATLVMLLFFPVLLFTACGPSTQSPERGLSENDRAALVALYNATAGSSWNFDLHWATDASIGTWYGVTTNAENRVISLTIAHNRLTGEIPPELGQLSELETLVLYDNRLTGAIPTELASLGRLRTLDLGSNRLDGEIPAELGDLLALETLDLTDNRLTGCVPVPVHRVHYGISDFGGLDPCPEPDRAALEEFYDATRGGGWANSQNWLEDGVPHPPLARRHD